MGSAVQLTLTGVGPTCETCAGPIDPPDQATVGGYTRCAGCDPEGDHWGWAYGDPCEACNPGAEQEAGDG